MKSPLTPITYPRFVLDNVLSRDCYNSLLQSFPHHLCVNGGDFFESFTVNELEIGAMKLSAEWKEYLSSLFEPRFKSELVRTCFNVSLGRYPRWQRVFLRRRLSNPNNYSINVALNRSLSGRYLPPHTDNSYKVLALVHYFSASKPDDESLGTRFFVAKNRRVLRHAVQRFNRLSDSNLTKWLPLSLLPMTSCNISNHTGTKNSVQENEKWFASNFTNDYTIPFGPNRIAGFVKMQGSFHSVDLRTSNDEAARLTVLINLNLKHSLIARVGQSFRTRVLRLSS